jgi:short-subunit dehydrogenase
MNNLSLIDQTVMITGGSSGIGQQLVKDFAGQGAHVVACSDHSQSMDQAGTDFERLGLKVDIQECDVRSTNQVERLADYTLHQYGHLDILINNAGYAVYRPFEESTVDEVCDILDVNLTGAMRCAKAFLPGMIERRSGRIVNISSIGGETIITPSAVYCAAKHGMVAWTKAMRYELAHFNIKVNVVCPAHTKTNFHDHPTFRRRDPYRSKNARSLTVEQVSAAVLDAIRKDRIVTYVPWWQGLLAWSLNALPLVTLPIWDRISRKRVKQLYEQIELEKTKLRKL